MVESEKKSLKKKNVRVEKNRGVENDFEEERKLFQKEKLSFDEIIVDLRNNIGDLEVQISDERNEFKRKEHVFQNGKKFLQ